MTPLPPSSLVIFTVSLLVAVLGVWGQDSSSKEPQFLQPPGNKKQHRTVDNTDGSVDENPRQRQRVLDKRNPLATEYQSIGDIGNVMLSNIDSEGVNERARFPFGRPFGGPKRSGSGEISYKYSDLSGSGFLQFKGTNSQILGKENRWAITVKGDRTGSNQVFEKMGLRWRKREFQGQEFFFIDRMRLSINSAETIRNQAVISVDHRLSKRHEIYLKSTIQDRTDNVNYMLKRYWFADGEIASLVPDGSKPGGYESVLVRDASSEVILYDVGGKRKISRVLVGGDVWGEHSRFDYSFYLSRWERESLGNINPIFRSEGIDYEYSLSNPAFPAVSVLNGRDLNEPSSFHFKEYGRRNSGTKDDDKAFQFNYERRMNLGSLAGSLKMGMLYRSKERENTYENTVFDEFNGDLLLDAVAGEDQRLVIRDTYLSGPSINSSAFRDLIETEAGNFSLNSGRSRIESDTNNYQASEEVIGAYFLQAFEIERWSLKGGVRFENTNLETTGNVLKTDDEGNYVSTDTVSGGSEYAKLLGAVELEYMLSRSTKLRAAWFQTLARPDYFDLVPFRRITTNFQFVSEGNPNLQPTRFDNLVLAAYLENETVGNLSIAAYYKKLNAFFYDSEDIIQGGPFDGYNRRRKENGNRASVGGVELGWERQLGFLRPLLGDITLTAFYIFSDTTADTDSRPGEVLRLPERSNHFAALTAKHNLGSFNTIFSLVYQSIYLEEIGSELARDEVMEDVLRMDLAFSFQLSKRLRSFLKLSNFVDWPERTYKGDPSRIKDNEYSSWKIETGLKYKF